MVGIISFHWRLHFIVIPINITFEYSYIKHIKTFLDHPISSINFALNQLRNRAIQDVTKRISSLYFTNTISNKLKKIITSQPAELSNGDINLFNDKYQQLTCSIIAGCYASDIYFRNNSICHVLCDELLWCAYATIDILECREIKIICNGDNSCQKMKVNVKSHHHYQDNTSYIIYSTYQYNVWHFNQLF